MRKTVPFWVVIVLCAVALVASSLLLVDYVRPAPVFCGAEGGCGVVKRTVFAYPLGIPTPLIGIGGFLAIGLAQLLPGRRARIAQAMLAAFAGIVAAGLLVVQAMMKTVCPFCFVADVVGARAARALGRACAPRLGSAARPAPARGRRRRGARSPSPRRSRSACRRRRSPPTVPAVIADEMRKTPRGKVTVVDFVDFECPFCRMTHADFGPLLEERKDKVRVARKHVPLRMHPHAMDAARAACCGEKLGKADEMAEALFTAPASELTPEGCEEHRRRSTASTSRASATA